MIRENLSVIREKIASICARQGRDPREITVVAVSKGRTVEQIKEVIACGIYDIGENRIQEALSKYNALRAAPCAQRITWHMVGHLQTNKAKEAVRLFDLIQSVDSLRIAELINAQAQKLGRIQDVLIEVKTSSEAAKFGMLPDEAIEAIRQMVEYKNIKVKGLMTIAAMVDNPEKTRPYFRMLRELRDKIISRSTLSCQLPTLSMGMTDDFEIAIEEGANMLRLGRAIFEG